VSPADTSGGHYNKEGFTMKKISEFFDKLGIAMSEFIKNHEKAIIKYSIAIPAILAAIIFLIWLTVRLITGIVGYIEAHLGAFIIIAAMLGGVLYLVYQRSTRERPVAQAPTVVHGEFQRQVRERTYVNVGTAVMFHLIIKLSGVYPFLKPTDIPSIYAPARITIRDNITYYQYAAVKKADIIKEEVEMFLKDELTRTLYDKEYRNLPDNTIWLDGSEYPALVITGTIDTGTHLLIDVVVMSMKYKNLVDYQVAREFRGRDERGADDDEFI
jgi:hypothetical protein